NEVRFSREDIPAYYAKHFGRESRTSVHAMYPGDRLVNAVFEPVSPYRADLQNGRLDHLIEQQYPEEVSAFRPTDRLANATGDQWTSRLAAHLDSQIKFHPHRALDQLSFSVRLRDLSGRNWFNVRWNGSRFEVVNSGAAFAASMANIETTTTVLENSI